MSKDEWAKIFPDLKELSPGVYEAEVKGYGSSYVGEYRAVQDYLKENGVSDQYEVHHIVQAADAEYYPKGTTTENAPAVALDIGYHKEAVHPRLNEMGLFEHRSETRADAQEKYANGYGYNLETPQLRQVADHLLSESERNR